MIKKYTWNLNGDAELWNNGTFDTVGECIEDVKTAIDLEDYEYCDSPTVVYIGETVPFGVSVDSTDILDRMAEDAWDYCGEAAESWEPYSLKKKEEIAELDDQLTKVVLEWMKKYNREPGMYRIDNINEYPLEQEK